MEIVDSDSEDEWKRKGGLDASSLVNEPIRRKRTASVYSYQIYCSRDILRTDHDNNSHTSVPSLHQSDAVPATSTSTNNLRRVDDFEARTVDRVMIRDDLSSGCA